MLPQTIELVDSQPVAHPTLDHMSRFALVVQAARLLGHVFDHVSKPDGNTLPFEETMQLDRTIRSLINACHRTSMPACAAVAICHR